MEDCPGQDEARASDSTIEECNGSPSSHLMIDSGCTRHLIGSSLAHFIEKRELVSKRMIRMANGSQCSSSMMVTARIPLHNGNTLVVSKALYTPELKGSYISVGQLSDIEGTRLTFVRDKLFIQRGSGTKKSTIGVAERSNNNLYFLRVREQSSEERLAAVHSDVDYALNLHCRLGHPDVRVLRKAIKEGSITGLPKEMKMKSFGDCIICTQGKTRRKKMGKARHPVSVIGEILHVDASTDHPRMKNGVTGYQIIIDGCSRYRWINFFKKRTENPDKIVSRVKVLQKALI